MKPLVAPRTERNSFPSQKRRRGGKTVRGTVLAWGTLAGGSPVPPGTPNSSRQLVRAFSFLSRYQLWQNPAGGGGILRIQAPFCLLRRHSPVRGITPPLRIEKPFGRAEKKKSLQPTCPYLQCGSPHRVLNLSITLKVPKSGLWKRFSFANFAGNCTIVFRKPNICSFPEKRGAYDII